MSFFDDPKPDEGTAGNEPPKINISGDATKFVEGMRKVLKALEDNPALRDLAASAAKQQAKKGGTPQRNDDAAAKAIQQIINHVVAVKLDGLFVARAIQKLIETRFEPSRKNVVRATMVWSYIVKRSVHAYRSAQHESDRFAKSVKTLDKIMKVDA